MLEALDALGYMADAGERRAILRADRRRGARGSVDARRDARLDAVPELRSALAGEVAAAGQRVFDLLAFVHDRVAVHRVAAHISHGAKDKRAYAHEVLDLMLAPDERALVAPLLDDAPPSDRLRRMSGSFPQPALAIDAQLRALIARSERWLSGFSRALAIRAAAGRGITDGVEAWLASTDPVVHQTAAWARAPEEKSSMLLIEKVIMLKTVPMFAQADEELLGEIATVFEEVEYRAGELIVAKGDVGESMYIVDQRQGARVRRRDQRSASSARRRSSVSWRCSIRSRARHR